MVLKECPDCGGRLKKGTETVRRNGLRLKFGYDKCLKCGETYYHEDYLDVWDEIRKEKLDKNPPPPYIENPKTKGSGILCAIPQTGTCPNKCEDCFFQSGRSYLEPLKKHLPNMPVHNDLYGPSDLSIHKVVRVNDGNDSNVDRGTVIYRTQAYPLRFFNTAIPKDLGGFPGPVVLTLNPGKMTDKRFFKLKNIPPNLMFVRFRANMWNRELAGEAVDYYTSRNVPVVMTFMAYFKLSVPKAHLRHYVFRKRTTNNYWAITSEAWFKFMYSFRFEPLVYSCGHVEGELGNTKCKHCGNCLREFFATRERMLDPANALGAAVNKVLSDPKAIKRIAAKSCKAAGRNEG